MKRICIVGVLPPPMGGDARAVQTLIESREFRERFTPSVVNLSDGTMRSAGGRVVTASKVLKILGAARELRRIASRDNPDVYYVLIAQSFAGSLRDVLLLRMIRKHKREGSRVVLHLHGGGFRAFFDGAPRWLQRLIRHAFSDVDAAIVLSPSLRAMFAGIVADAKIKVVPNGVDQASLVSSVDVDVKLSETAPKRSMTFLYLSNMIQEKGYLDLLAAGERLCRQRSDCRVVFAGQFPEDAARAAFVEALAEADVHGNMEYAGVVQGQSKYRLLRDCDVFVLPTYMSFGEGQPISILEAMGAGMPVITTRLGGIPDVVETGTNGMLVSARDPDALAAAMEWYCDHRDLVRDIGMMNRAKVLESFTEETYTAALLDVLLEAVGRSSSDCRSQT